MVACTCNPVTLEAEFRNVAGSFSVENYTFLQNESVNETLKDFKGFMLLQLLMEQMTMWRLFLKDFMHSICLENLE